MHPLLVRTIETVEKAEVTYCVMRDGEKLEAYEQGGEVDLLVARRELKLLRGLLRRLGFVELPGWGYAPHHFFVAYDVESDSWLKLDVVTAVSFGSPIHALPSSLANNCLQNRRRCGLTWVPSPEDELITMLLHCVLDKGYFAPHRSARLQALCEQITDEPYMSRLVAAYWMPQATWADLERYIRQGEWTLLLAHKGALTRLLKERAPVKTAVNLLSARVARKANRVRNLVKPSAQSVTLLAPDGAGKSTLAKGIESSLYFPTRQIYMGMYQKGAAGKLLKLPGMGFVGRILMQWGRYASARWHQANGRFVIFDRYTYDAMLPSSKKLSRGKELRRWALAHACPAPDLILFLDAPGDVLYARKGEHSPAFLEEQRQGYLQLKQELPQMQVVNVDRDPDCVRREVTSIIWRSYAQNLN